MDFGCALWKTRKAAALPQKANDYLLEVCRTGEETSEATASTVASQMKS